MKNIIFIIILSLLITSCNFGKKEEKKEVPFGKIFEGEECSQDFDPVCAKVACNKTGCISMWESFPNECYAKRENIIDMKKGLCEDMLKQMRQEKKEEIIKNSLVEDVKIEEVN